MKLKLAAALALGIAMNGGTLKADDAKKPAWYEKINSSGFVDAYYQYNMNGRSAPNGPTGRAFDTTQQQFAFSGAKLALSETDDKSKASGELDLFYGPTAKVFNSSLSADSVAVEQAFYSQAFGPLTIKLGKFTTFVGTEVIETPANNNYSRGTLFGAIPYYHVGLEATYGIMDGLAFMAYTGNGNSVDTASSEARDWGATLSFSKVKGLGLTAIYYMESSLTPTTTAGMVSENIHYIDILGSYAITDSLSTNVEYLYKTRIAAKDTDTAGKLITTNTQTDWGTGKQIAYSPKQMGYALYLSYSTPLTGLSILPRFEQFYVPEGNGSLTTDTTLTLKYASGPLCHSLEYRNDWMNNGGFVGVGGADPAKLVYYQNTLTYGATYSF